MEQPRPDRPAGTQPAGEGVEHPAPHRQHQVASLKGLLLVPIGSEELRRAGGVGGPRQVREVRHHHCHAQLHGELVGRLNS